MKDQNKEGNESAREEEAEATTTPSPTLRPFAKKKRLHDLTNNNDKTKRKNKGGGRKAVLKHVGEKGTHGMRKRCKR